MLYVISVESNRWYTPSLQEYYIKLIIPVGAMSPSIMYLCVLSGETVKLPTFFLTYVQYIIQVIKTTMIRQQQPYSFIVFITLIEQTQCRVWFFFSVVMPEKTCDGNPVIPIFLLLYYYHLKLLGLHISSKKLHIATLIPPNLKLLDSLTF